MANVAVALAQAFNRALSAYKQGKLAEAEQLCRQIITTKQDIFDVFYLLAFVQLGLGEKEAALKSYDRATTLRPNHAQALKSRGDVLQELKRFDEAIASYDRALVAWPDYAEALYNRGNALAELKQFNKALTSYDRALAVWPDYAQALNNRGRVLHEVKRYTEALASYDRALAAQPNYAEALNNRGKVLQELKRLDEALASFDRAIAVQPDYVAAFNNRGYTLKELKRFDEALASYDRALAKWPDYVEALNNRGITLVELKRYDEALASYDRALAVRPDLAEPLNNRGNALQELKRFEEALVSYDRALAVQPDLIDALNNRGNALQKVRRFDEALASYDRAIAVRADYAEAHFSRALCQLLLGDFDRGWKTYEWRWRTKRLQNYRRSFTKPLWLGDEDICGKTILIHGEQGYGDVIQFCRYVPMVAARGARVVLEVEKPLRELMNSAAGATRVISRGEPLPDFDVHCPLLSLPLAFATRIETVPSATPYLVSSLHATTDWNTRLSSKRRPRVGLAWSGRPTHKDDRERSIGLSALSSLFDIEATFVSLQKDLHAADEMLLRERNDLLDFSAMLNDFADTAALIMNLDLVISVDTSVAHLAGALAKPVWVLLPFLPDWRWLLDRDDSPWYPTARLFRQDAARAWESVIVRVQDALFEFVQHQV